MRNIDSTDCHFDCRICQETSSRGLLIAPCSCKGSIKWVHRECLDKWRQTSGADRLLKCTICGTFYKFHENESNLWKICQLYALVGMRVILQILIFVSYVFLYFLHLMVLATIGIIVSNHVIAKSRNQTVPSVNDLLTTSKWLTYVFLLLGCLIAGGGYAIQAISLPFDNTVARAIHNRSLWIRIICILATIPAWPVIGLVCHVWELTNFAMRIQRDRQMGSYIVQDLDENNDMLGQNTFPLESSPLLHSSSSLSLSSSSSVAAINAPDSRWKPPRPPSPAYLPPLPVDFVDSTSSALVGNHLHDYGSILSSLESGDGGLINSEWSN